MKHRLTIGNERKQVLQLMLEPWGEDYWMKPGETFDLIPDKPSESFHFAVAYFDSYVAAYAEGGCEYVRVHCHGLLLECGHQRPKSL